MASIYFENETWLGRKGGNK